MFFTYVAINPYPFGYSNDPVRVCTCSHSMVTRYQKRISGPMLEKIDIHIEVLLKKFEELSDNRQEEASEEIRARVEQARQRQRARFADLNNQVMINADIRVAESVNHVNWTKRGNNTSRRR